MTVRIYRIVRHHQELEVQIHLAPGRAWYLITSYQYVARDPEKYQRKGRSEPVNPRE